MRRKVDKTQKIPKTEMNFRTIPSRCCHCGAIYRLAQWKVFEGKKTGVSHGLCPACYAKEIEKTK